MANPRPTAVQAADLPMRRGSRYPAPHDQPCASREKRALGDVFGLQGECQNFRVWAEFIRLA